MVFGSLISSSQKNAIYLGAAEAEAETTAQSRISLMEVYEDFHNLLPALTGEKFIVVGRKGTGKSAFAEYICAKSENDPNLFAQFIRASEFHIEKQIQVGQQSDASIDSKSFFLWLIYTNILRLFSENEAIQENKEYELLRQFLKKNSGYINIKDYEIKTLVEKHSFDVSIEQFKRFFRSTFGRNVEIKSERAPYYKLLPHLEEIMIKVLCSKIEIENNNSYCLFFDDLDVWFNANDQASADSLMSLIRVCRKVNNEIFGKNRIKAKAVILLRDDIETYLSTRYADSAKMFSSYSTKINWYQEEYASNTAKEDELNLKKFINRRIKHAFTKANIPFNPNDPWSSLINNQSQNDKTTFKKIIQQTLFRPRDLILFFKPLENGKFTIPLNHSEVETLIIMFSTELATEIKSELSAFYNPSQIETIFGALAKMITPPPTYSTALDIIEQNCKDVSGQDVLEYLFDRSIIGTINSSGWYSFKCRSDASTGLDKSQKIVVQYGVRSYLQTRYL